MLLVQLFTTRNHNEGFVKYFEIKILFPHIMEK